MRIATWNVNSLRVRLPQLTQWLQANPVEAIGLQELKQTDEDFPAAEIASLGLHAAWYGQKTYNGVAILARGNIEDVRTGLPGMSDDEQARYIEGAVELDGRMIRIASIYLPNGNPVDSEKFPYKLRWMDALRDHAADLLKQEEPVVLAGDYNIIPENGDVYDPDRWRDDALFRMESRRKFRAILNLGYTEAYRTLHREIGRYTFWDYQGGAWQKGFGLRIDHLLLSPQATDLLEACDIDTAPRGKPKASDHTPIWCTLKP